MVSVTWRSGDCESVVIRATRSRVGWVVVCPPLRLNFVLVRVSSWVLWGIDALWGVDGE